MTRLEHQLLSRQSDLQAEADLITSQLRLDDRLSPLGQPFRVGSAALGLMVWRDLDITVVCPSLDLNAVADLAATFARDDGVSRLEFRNDTGRWNTDPAYPDGLYIGLHYRSAADQDWRLDIWFVDEPDRQPDLAHLTTMAPRLTPETRAAILRIKSAWHAHPTYGSIVRSVDIYTAVLDDGVQSPEQFEAWLNARG